MKPASPAEPSVFLTGVDRSGRMTLPQIVREVLNLNDGDELLVIREGDGFRIQTYEQTLKAAQEYFCSFVPPDVSLVDELLAERRAEFEREQEEMQQDEDSGSESRS